MENRTICLLEEITKKNYICGTKINKDTILINFVANKVEILVTQSFKRNFLPVQVSLLALTTELK